MKWKDWILETATNSIEPISAMVAARLGEGDVEVRIEDSKVAGPSRYQVISVYPEPDITLFFSSRLREIENVIQENEWTLTE
jgi:hypothetical protein